MGIEIFKFNFFFLGFRRYEIIKFIKVVFGLIFISFGFLFL